MKQAGADTLAVQLSIKLVGGDGIDLKEIDAMTRQLLSKLEEMPGAEQVSLQVACAERPHGAKSGAETVALGEVLISVLPTPIPALINFFKAWILLPGSAPVRIKVQKAGQSVEIEFDPRSPLSED